MQRTILHSDLNNFYASVECLHHPELRGHPVVVGGSVEERHGIVLAKNDIAKRYGIKTGEALWQAREKCTPVIVVSPDFPLYLRFSKLAREIYTDYTNRVEPFGIDEAWMDISGSDRAGVDIADEIRRRIFRELGLTVSIGVSYNKIFAKLGSDMKKPDAITEITEDNYRERVWELPVSELLYVGPATAKRLVCYGIDTIGKLAQASPEFLHRQLGKMGDVLHGFANGMDTAAVAEYDSLLSVKSIGNSTTTHRDLKNEDDVRMVIFTLAESVAARVREQGFYAATLSISVRDTQLNSFSRQCKIKPSNLADEYAHEAIGLFERNYSWYSPIRSVGISVTDFCHDNQCAQLDMLTNQARRDMQEKLEGTVDTIRHRFGNLSVQRAVLLQDKRLTGFNPQENHTIHPVSYF